MENEAPTLLLIDMQTKLVPAVAGSEELLKNTAMLLKGAAVLKWDVLVTEQYPAGLGPTVPELTEIFPENTPVFAKTSFSCFGNSAFASALRSKNRKTLVICGVECDICIYQTATDALKNGYEVYIAADAVASRDSRNRDLALAMLRHEGAKVLPAAAVLFRFLGDAVHPDFRTISKLVK